MERIMNVMKSACLVSLLLTLMVSADEGFWTNLRVVGGTGAYYSAVEHPDIALEKEVLKYSGSNGVLGGCEAYFLFKNTNSDPVSVKVGFPVKIVVPLRETNELDPAIGFRRDFKAKIGLTTKMISWNKFKSELNSIGERSAIIGNFTVNQDRRKIVIDSVLVEFVRLSKDTAVVKYHFLHQLDFQPDSYSNVRVTYTAFSSTMNTGAPATADYINWQYVLGTGKTWKGPIKTIYFLLPEHLNPELPESFQYIGNFKQNKIFKAEKYEPLSTDEVHVRYIGYSHGDAFYIQTLKEPKTPTQNFVVLKNASSYLPQRTWINSYFTGVVPRADTLWGNIFDTYFFSKFFKPPESLTPAYVIEDLPVTCQNIGFGPLSLFDGFTESAWCEGVKGDGLDEWVEFELKEDVLGIAVYNGFSKSPESFLWMDEDLERVSKIKATYGNNNRAKLIELISSDSSIKHKIILKDTPEQQVFPDIFLPKGIYKLYIRDIYKGAKWDDTCLGELEFYLANAREIVEQDDFFKQVYFTQFKAYRSNSQNFIFYQELE